MMESRTAVFVREAGPGAPSDKEFIMKAIENDFGVYYYASDELKRDPDVMCNVLQRSLYGLCHVAKYAIEHHSDNKRLMMSVVGYAGHYLRDLPESLRDDDDVVNIAVSNTPFALKYASDRIRSNKKFVEKVVVRDPTIYYCIGESLKSDKDIAIAAVSNARCCILHTLPSKWRNDVDVCVTAVKRCRESFDCVPKRLRNDIGFLKLITRCVT